MKNKNEFIIRSNLIQYSYFRKITQQHYVMPRVKNKKPEESISCQK